MTQTIKNLACLLFFCILWALTRSLQFVFEVCDLNYEACEISNSELGLHLRIHEVARKLAPGLVKA